MLSVPISKESEKSPSSHLSMCFIPGTSIYNIPSLLNSSLILLIFSDHLNVQIHGNSLNTHIKNFIMNICI